MRVRKGDFVVGGGEGGKGFIGVGIVGGKEIGGGRRGWLSLVIV